MEKLLPVARKAKADARELTAMFSKIFDNTVAGRMALGAAGDKEVTSAQP